MAFREHAVTLRISRKILRAALEWADAMVQEAIRDGRSLSEDELATARRIGVAHPEEIRIVLGPIPLPKAISLAKWIERMGIGEQPEGLTLGYAIFLDCGLNIPKGLLVHELRHCYQGEQAGSLNGFVCQWLSEIAKFGYLDAPMEVDARAWAWASVLTDEKSNIWVLKSLEARKKGEVQKMTPNIQYQSARSQK